jgi:hypothetical protein
MPLLIKINCIYWVKAREKALAQARADIPKDEPMNAYRTV